MAEQFTQGYALLIGVGADLPNTIADAEGLAAILRDEARCAYAPDHVQTLTGENATRAHILTALDTLAQTTHADSTVVVYFSGHGYEVQTPSGPTYCLLPFGAEQQRLSETTLSGQEFVARLAAIPAQKILILLDCCHAGGVGDFGLTSVAKAPLPPEARDWLAKGAGRVLIASSRAGELSYTGKPYSQFTLALIEALCGEGAAKADGYVRVADLALHAREVVSHRTHYRQRPLLHFEHADNFVVAYYAAGEAKAPGLPAHIPRAPAEEKTLPGPLPPPPPDFTGREAELVALLALSQKHARLELCGPGGAGKSTLALKLAEDLAPAYPDAQLYVDFQGAAKKKKPLSPAQALIEIIHAFEPEFAVTGKSLSELRGRYLHHLSNGRNILFFDNVRSAAQIEPLLPNKNCLTLITSHQRLAVPGAAIQAVGGLPPAEASALVLKIAERLGPHAEALAEACGYLPYALRLAASTLNNQPSLDPALYARRLHDTRQLLGLVPASLDCAYQLVSKAQRDHWRTLAVFPGEFDQQAAELVWGLTAEAAMDILGALVEYGLLEWNASTRHYRLHDVARAFARNKKDPTPAVFQRLRRLMKRRALPEAQRRLAALWLTRLRWLDHVPTPASAEMLTYLDLVIRYVDTPADMQYLERQTSTVLKRTGKMRARQTQARLLVSRAVMRGQLNRLDEAEKDYAAASKLAHAEGVLAAQIALGAGNLASIQGERAGDKEALERAVAWYLRALPLAQAAHSDVILETSIGKELGYNYALLRRWPEAEAACAQALAILRARFQEIADPALAVRHFAMMLETASTVYLEKGRSKRPKTSVAARREYEAALPLLLEEIEMLTAAGLESMALAIAYENAGDCLLALSQCEGGAASQRTAACEKWKQAVELALRLGIHDIAAEDTARLQKHCGAETTKH